MSRETNFRNADRWEYNCGGYALDTFEWEHPYDYEDSSAYVYYNMHADGFLRGVPHQIKYLVYRMQGKMRLIKKESEAKPNERIVLYRTGADDFHFVRKGKNGNYYHKRGGLPIIHRMTKEEAHDPEGWCKTDMGFKYTSPVYIFAVTSE